MAMNKYSDDRLRGQGGFTLLELMVVVGLIGTLTVMAMMVSPAFTNQAKADAGTEQVLDLFRSAREVAISQRRNVEVRFIGTTGLQTVRRDIGTGGVQTGTTTLRTIELENKMQFRIDSAITVDTDDHFGGTLSTATAFGATGSRMFTSEGTFVDANGDPLNGTLFISNPALANSQRAVTVMGATALIRAWRWDGKKWVE
jgi:prepilin-type N-terminal cleavage/methylation domain-containing protein